MGKERDERCGQGGSIGERILGEKGTAQAAQLRLACFRRARG